MLPVVGIIHARDRHPSARLLADLQDEQAAGLVLCDAHLPLDEALERVWEQDSHLMLYRVDADRHGDEFAFARVSKRSPFVSQLEQAGGRIRVPVLVFDHDLPGHREWSPDGPVEFLEALEGLDIPPPTAWYTTLHGSRFVYVLTEEVSQLDAEELMQGMIARFARAGVELDPRCKEWTRVFRLPRTVRQDTGQPFYDDPRFISLLSPETRLDPNTIERIKVGQRDILAEVQVYEAEMPDADDVRAMLTRHDRSGKAKDSAWLEEAKLFLTGRDSYNILFAGAPLAVGEQNWNTQVTRTVGQVIGMLARRDLATPEGIFALLYAAIEQLQERENEGAQQTDWFGTTWDLICRMWANEVAQIEAERQAMEAKLAEAHEHRETLIEHVRAVRPEDVPADAQEAQEWFERRMIASDGMRHYVMRRDGSYNIRPVSDSMLVPMIRDLGMEDIIPTSEIRGRSIVPRTATTILNHHATPITAIECSSRDEVAYIDGEAGHKVLHIPVHRLNPKLQPRYSIWVDEWLRRFAGTKYDRLVEWLTHCLDVRRPICALNLYGAPGTGKGMLALGIAECFEGEHKNDGRALGKWNLGLLDSPVVNCDEGVPSIASDEALSMDQAFRSLVTGGKLTIRAMRRDPFNAEIFPRILFTSNDRDIIRSIVGHRDLTQDDIEAIEVRLLTIHVEDSAQIYLTSRGNTAWTAGWVAGEKRSEYVLANHIYYLFQNRRPVDVGNNRLVVEGERGSMLVREMRLRSRGSQTVLRALLRLVESPGAHAGIHQHGERLWVTPAGVVQFAEGTFSMAAGDLTLPTAGRILRQFAVHDVPSEGRVPMSSPPEGLRGRWIEIDLPLLYQEGARYGVPMLRLESIIKNMPNGLHLMAAAQVAAQSADA